MFSAARTATNVIIWLTASAVPFQSGVWWGCACVAECEPTGVAAEQAGDCCGGATAPDEPNCCADAASRPSCCQTSATDRQCGCDCGASCHCAQRNRQPNSPRAPAPDNGRSQHQVELADLGLAALVATGVERQSEPLLPEFDSAFSQPGPQVCVLLCRFTL